MHEHPGAGQTLPLPPARGNACTDGHEDTPDFVLVGLERRDRERETPGFDRRPDRSPTLKARRETPSFRMTSYHGNIQHLSPDFREPHGD